MATRNAIRSMVSRRFSSSGKVLNEEEKAAENIYIKKMEQEKLARKGAGEQATTTTAGEVKATIAEASSGPKVSEDKHRNYAVVAGVVTLVGAIGWYMKSGGKKQPVPQE